jgi:hypothetical protein
MSSGGQWEIPADAIEFTAKLGSGTSGQVFKGLFNRQGKFKLPSPLHLLSLSPFLLTPV